MRTWWAFAEMSEDVSRICEIIAHDLARTHVSYYNDDAKRELELELSLYLCLFSHGCSG